MPASHQGDQHTLHMVRWVFLLRNREPIKGCGIHITATRGGPRFGFAITFDKRLRPISSRGAGRHRQAAASPLPAWSPSRRGIELSRARRQPKRLRTTLSPSSKSAASELSPKTPPIVFHLAPGGRCLVFPPVGLRSAERRAARVFPFQRGLAGGSPRSAGRVGATSRHRNVEPDFQRGVVPSMADRHTCHHDTNGRRTVIRMPVFHVFRTHSAATA